MLLMVLHAAAWIAHDVLLAGGSAEEAWALTAAGASTSSFTGAAFTSCTRRSRRELNYKTKYRPKYLHETRYPRRLPSKSVQMLCEGTALSFSLLDFGLVQIRTG